MVNVDNSVLPLDWYIDTLKAVRKKAGDTVPASVFSDGTEDELKGLVSMPRVKRVDYGSGLSDMRSLRAAAS